MLSCFVSSVKSELSLVQLVGFLVIARFQREKCLTRTERMPPMQRIRATLIVSLLAAVVPLTGCKPGADSTANLAPLAPTAVRVVKAKRGEATRSVTLPGTVAAYQQAALYAKATGYVKTVKVDKGDSVA